jgi:hypothetical protein
MEKEEAIEALNEIFDDSEYSRFDGWYGTAMNMAIEALKQPEIIRCKDCIHSDGIKMVDGWTYCAEGMTLVKYEDGYCSEARRREE